MKSICTISEEQRMHITAIIASVPRNTLNDFKMSISDLKPEELKYLKQELSILASKGHKQYMAAFNSL